MASLDLIELNFKSENAAASRLVLQRGALSAEYVTMPGEIAYEFAVSGAANYVAVHDIVLTDGELVTESGQSHAERDLRRKITFVPAGMSVRGWGHPKARRNSFTAIHFGADAIPEPLATSSIWERERVYFTDAKLAATFAKLYRALNSEGPLMGLLVESLCDLAIVELVCGHHPRAPSIRDRPALKSSDVDRVREFIAAHLADEISLSDLARVVGLSKYYFCRAYKSTTGRSPYHEILAMRVEIARDVLIRGASIKSAAARTGFSNLGQFSRTFKQFTGLSPSIFAKSAQ